MAICVLSCVLFSRSRREHRVRREILVFYQLRTYIDERHEAVHGRLVFLSSPGKVAHSADDHVTCVIFCIEAVLFNP